MDMSTLTKKLNILQGMLAALPGEIPVYVDDSYLKKELGDHNSIFEILKCELEGYLKMNGGGELIILTAEDSIFDLIGVPVQYNFSDWRVSPNGKYALPPKAPVDGQGVILIRYPELMQGYSWETYHQLVMDRFVSCSGYKVPDGWKFVSFGFSKQLKFDPAYYDRLFILEGEDNE